MCRAFADHLLMYVTGVPNTLAYNLLSECFEMFEDYKTEASTESKFTKGQISSANKEENMRKCDFNSYTAVCLAFMCVSDLL